jgi:hypothetical protein
MYGNESIVLQRDVNMVQIPDGTPGILPKGHVVTLYQNLGGNFTVTTERGYMVRIGAADADALGKEPAIVGQIGEGLDAETIEHNAWDVLKTIYDLQLPRDSGESRPTPCGNHHDLDCAGLRHGADPATGHRIGGQESPGRR